MLKICIWMNIPSHHQSAFFRALNNHKNIDLQVRYYEKVPCSRKELGWEDENNLPSNQAYIDNINDLEKSVTDWKNRINIIPGFTSPFLKELIKITIKENVKWIHWSERSGVRLATLLHFNYFLIDLFYPLFLYLKGYKQYAKQVNNYSIGSFAISELARNDFIKWGIKKNKIKFLPYSLDALSNSVQKLENLKQPNELLFMYIGSLYELKGISQLLNAFQRLLKKSTRCKLVLIGDDRSNGLYKKQAERLNILNHVNFIGVVQSNKINEYLEQADVFILPTLFDGWGAVLNEAASLSKPIISTDQAGSAYHLIEDSKNGFIVKAGNENALLKAMQFYIENPLQISKHGKKSFELFKKISPEKSAELFISNITYFLKENT